MSDKLIEKIMLENKSLREQITKLKSHVESLKSELSDLRSDVVVQRAEARNRP